MERFTDPLDRASGQEQAERQRILDTRKRAREAEESAIQSKDDEGRIICEECGEAIHPERLKALPHTVVCVGCQEHFEIKQRIY